MRETKSQRAEREDNETMRKVAWAIRKRLSPKARMLFNRPITSLEIANSQWEECCENGYTDEEFAVLEQRIRAAGYKPVFGIHDIRSWE